MVLFGQIIVGPPGCGKTTYCMGMQMFIEAVGRNCQVVNLDFANDNLPYTAAVDVRELVSLERVMEEFELGPNGGLVYCMEYLLANFSWLEEKLKGLGSQYILFDCPGQVELYTHHTCVKELFDSLKGIDCRLCSVHLVDAYYCCEPTTFISAVLLVASTMLRLGLPHINVLSKVDLLPLYGPLPFKLDFFTEMVDLMPLVRYMDGSGGAAVTDEEDIDDLYSKNNDDNHSDGDEYNNDDEYNDYNNNNDSNNDRKKDQESTNIIDHENRNCDIEPKDSEMKQKNKIKIPPTLQSKHRKMTEGLCEVLSDFGLVSFLPMNIQDGETVGRVLGAIDKANGYSFASSEAQEILKTKNSKKNNSNHDTNTNSVSHLFKIASQELETTYSRSLEISERYEKK